MLRPCTEREVCARSLLQSLLPVRDLCEVVVEYAREFQGVRCEITNPERALAWLTKGPLAEDISLIVAEFLVDKKHPARSFAGPLCVMPCGRIASGSWNDVSVWNSAGVQRLPWNSNQLNVMTVLPDGRTIAMGYADGSVFFNDTESKNWPAANFFNDPPILMAVLSNNMLAVGTVHNWVMVFDTTRESCVWSHRPLTSRHLLQTMVKFGDGFVTGDDPGQVRVWSAQGASLRIILHAAAVKAMTVVDDGALAVAVRHTVIVRGHECLVKQSPDRITRLEGHESTVLSLVKLEAGRLASGDSKGTMRVWHVPSGACLFKCVTDSPVRGLNVLLGGLLASRSSDGLVRVWDERGKLQRTIKAHEGAITHFCVLPSGLLITGGVDQQLRAWV